MPRRRRHYGNLRSRLQRGKGVIDWVKNKASSFNNWMKEKKPFSKVLDIPLLGTALKATPYGVPLWIGSKLGYGKLGYGRNRIRGIKPKKRRKTYRKYRKTHYVRK